MPIASVPHDLTDAQLAEAIKRYRANTKAANGDPELTKFFMRPLDGHESICECADCAEVRDAALRQFDQLMEHQCLYYVIQVTQAMDALCKTAILRWASNDPSAPIDFDSVYMEHAKVADPMANYMAHPDTVAVIWRGVQKTIAKQIAARK